MYERILEEYVIPGKPLGRHVRHDPRSLQYLVKPKAALAKSITWHHMIDVLDQGTLGSCTGNALVAALGTNPYFPTLENHSLDQALAVSIYAAATHIDPWGGSYPPDDTGSDGLSVAKAATTMGLISGYRHAISLDAAITALQDGPIITGVSWYEGFDTPNGNGKVAKTGELRGGHEVCLLGVDMERQELLALNSWGPSWGNQGKFFWNFSDFSELLEDDGDVTAFVPLTKPVPQPKPHPDSTLEDITFARSITKWLDKNPWFYKELQGAARTWLQFKQLP